MISVKMGKCGARKIAMINLLGVRVCQNPKSTKSRGQSLLGKIRVFPGLRMNKGHFLVSLFIFGQVRMEKKYLDTQIQGENDPDILLSGVPVG